MILPLVWNDMLCCGGKDVLLHVVGFRSDAFGINLHITVGTKFITLPKKSRPHSSTSLMSF